MFAKSRTNEGDYLNRSLFKMIGVSNSNHFCQELHSGS